MSILDQSIDPNIVNILYGSFLIILTGVIADIIETFWCYQDISICKRCGKRSTYFKIAHFFACTKKESTD